MKKILTIGAFLLMAGTAFGQSITYDRIGMNRLVRDIIGEPTATYYADTTINRLVNIANKQTKAILGPFGPDADTTITTTLYATSYDIPVGAIEGDGAVIGVIYKHAGETGMYEGLRPVPIDLVGRIAGSYAVANQQIHLGFAPPANDTLIVYYVDEATDLLDDDSTLAVGDEDALAVANLAISMLLERDKQTQQAQTFYTRWRDYIDRKRGVTTGAGQ